MKRILAFMLMLCMLFPMQEALLEEKSVEGTGHGYGGELKVQLVMEGETIKDIILLEDKESSPVIKRAFSLLKERILSANSPVVDSVSGATFSSFAIKTAVAAALKEAGIECEKITFNTKAAKTEVKQPENLKTKLLIVGGGPAGLAAAISAKEAGLDDVMLIEKLDILSGNGKFDMNFFDLINSKAQKEAGNEYSKEKFIESKKNAGNSEERLMVWAEGANVLDQWLRGMDIQLNYNYGGTNHMAEADAYAGEHIQDGLEKKVKALGVDVRIGTKGVDLLFDGKKVVGVKAENKDGSFDIFADAVILATGGFSNNKELLAKYVPGSEKLETSNQMGATGDFVPLFEKYGIKTDKMDVLSVFKLIIKNRRDLTGAGDGFILVNANGERFAAENSSGLALGQKILEQGKVFYIYDQNLYESFYRLKKHNALGYHTSANSLEELAEKLGINKDNLLKTVDTFNQAVEGKIQDPFREKAFERKFKEEGPYYGVEVESAIHMTKGGVVANEKTEVLNVNDEVIEGLYAAGEVTWISGAYSASVVFGRIAGEQAANKIIGK